MTDGKDKLTVPLRYAFGQHSNTFVLERDGVLYEGLMTWYESIGGTGITPGDQGITPHNLVEALGRELRPGEGVACFGCHASTPAANGQPVLSQVEPGVHCEHCHTGAGAHLRDIVHGKTDTIPKKLGALSAEDTSAFCGQCHRTWAEVIKMGAWGPSNVRFAPYRLANSKCFNGTDRRIACTGCHDPHKPLVRDDAMYDGNCLACHGASAGSGATKEAVSPRHCPVATKNCVSCHMPRVEIPGGPLTFADHQIRIVRPGEAYPD